MFSLLKSVFGQSNANSEGSIGGQVGPVPTTEVDASKDVFLEPEDTRVCIALETEKASHVVLFDSESTFEGNEAGQRPIGPRDGQMLCELMFGSSPMRKPDTRPGWNNAETKVHIMNDAKDGQRRMLITKLFIPKPGGTSSPDGDVENDKAGAYGRHGRRPSLGGHERGIMWPAPKGLSRIGGGRQTHTPTGTRAARGTLVATGVSIRISSSDIARLFLLSHFPLIELRMEMLLVIVEKCILRLLDLSRITGPVPPPSSTSSVSGGIISDMAPINASSVPIMALQGVKQLAETVRSFADNLFTLFNVPRLPRPLWLDLALETVGASTPFASSTSSSSSTPSASSVSFLMELIDSPQIKLYDMEVSGWTITAAVTAILSCHHAWIGTVLAGMKGGSEGEDEGESDGDGEGEGDRSTRRDSVSSVGSNVSFGARERPRVRTHDKDRHRTSQAFPGDWTDMDIHGEHDSWRFKPGSACEQASELFCGIPIAPAPVKARTRIPSSTSKVSKGVQLGKGPVHTVVFGFENDTSARLKPDEGTIDSVLHVLSYFIRCQETFPVRHWADLAVHDSFVIPAPDKAATATAPRDTFNMKEKETISIKMPAVTAFAALPPREAQHEAHKEVEEEILFRDLRAVHALRFSLARSLFLGICDRYVSGAALMGISTFNNSTGPKNKRRHSHSHSHMQSQPTSSSAPPSSSSSPSETRENLYADVKEALSFEAAHRSLGHIGHMDLPRSDEGIEVETDGSSTNNSNRLNGACPSTVFRGGAVICPTPRREAMDAARCVMVDLSQASCEVLTSTASGNGSTRTRSVPVRPSPAVHHLLQTLRRLNSLGIPADTGISYIEGFLQRLVLQARALMAARPKRSGVVLSAAALAPSLGVHVDDLPLLISVADALWRTGL